MATQLASAVFRQLAEVMLHFKGPTTEHDYKSGKETPRYVREMVYPDLQIDPGQQAADPGQGQIERNGPFFLVIQNYSE